ncbi:hypothetical protein FIBSPDRAFT_445729 [Athelia psychrophila]|uniref:Uncharacterized protein n=1 Tax=Athelia psychrophila TaxID=1759441 RepID=A0A166M9Z7_9AGAM|nr:hypothetical protein FIBSPDRAFT_445729 [Fibularhizoctonia sp. CBS 109695]
MTLVEVAAQAEMTFAHFWEVMRYGFTSEPTRLQPVYMPAWIIDSEVEKLPTEGSTEVIKAQFMDSYMPGCTFNPLSRISFNSSEIVPGAAVPFTKDLAFHSGQEVLCLPYTLSPLALGRPGTSLSRMVAGEKQVDFAKDVNVNFAAMYPVLIPLWLSQHEHEGKTTTVLMEASSFPGRVYFELPELPNLPSLLARFVHPLFDNYHSSQGDPSPFFAIRSPPRPAALELAEGVQKWLSHSLASDTLLAQALGPVSTTDFDDPRVRPFESEERDANLAYLTACGQLNDLEYAFTALDGLKATDDGPFVQMTEQLKKEREEREPQWWKTRTA